MYPTFPKGKGENPAELARETVAWPKMRRYPGGIFLFNTRYFGYQLQHGDIVSFSNQNTKKLTLDETGHEAGLVKRVIALGGDTLEIRDGFVRLNGKEINEPYTASGRSTFGGTFLPDCRILTIPAGQAFVLGDNRKGSSDSRHELGLISLSDIDHVIPYQEQQEFQSLWRDASKDYLLANKPFLDTDQYINLLNKKRLDSLSKPLKYQPLLEASARKRADVIIKYDDLSYEATKSSYTMEKAMKAVGYSNIVWGEAPTLGYYTAEELLENFFQFPESKKFIMQKDFQETGIVAKVGEINGCPVQVIVQHFGGYVPPNYDPEVIESWKKALEGLRSSYPSWQKIKEYPREYSAHRSDYDEVLGIFTQRIDHLTAIVSRMQANQWLTDQENAWVEQDKNLAKRLEELTAKLNKN
jgi:signal peptidase I